MSAKLGRGGLGQSDKHLGRVGNDRTGRPVSLGQDTGQVRQHNRAIILELLRTQGPLSCPALACRGGVSRPTVIEITNDLTREGLIRRVGYGPSTGGRRPVLLELVPEAQFAIGIRIGLASITAVMTDLRATVRGRVEIPFKMEAGPAIFLERLALVMDDLVPMAPDGWANIRGIGVALPAPILTDEPVTIWSARYTGWEQFYVKEALAKQYRLPILVDNNANAAALGEHFFGAGRGARHLLYLLISQGLGAGVICDGELYRGAAGTAGEIGHTTIGFDGPLCSCGRHGCLEVYVCTEAIVRRARQACILSGQPAPTMTADEVIDAALQGDALARRVIEETGRYLGIGLANAIHVYSPEKIILGGPVARAGAILLTSALEVTRRQVLLGLADRLPIVFGQLGEDAEAIGAAVLVLRDLFKISVPETVVAPTGAERSHHNGDQVAPIAALSPAESMSWRQPSRR